MEITLTIGVPATIDVDHMCDIAVTELGLSHGVTAEEYHFLKSVIRRIRNASRVTYARKCSVTDEGMNEGWTNDACGDYFKYEKDALQYCKDNGCETLDEAVEQDLLYWTEWEADDHQYAVVSGVLREIDEEGDVIEQVN